MDGLNEEPGMKNEADTNQEVIEVVQENQPIHKARSSANQNNAYKLDSMVIEDCDNAES